MLLVVTDARSAPPPEPAAPPGLITCCTPTGECSELSDAECDALAVAAASPIVPGPLGEDEEHECGNGPTVPLSLRPEARLVLVESCAAAASNSRTWQSCLLVSIDGCRSTNERTAALWPEVLDTERVLPWARPPSVGAVMRVVLKRGLVVGAEEDVSCGL